MKNCPMSYEIPHCYITVRYGKIFRGCVSDTFYSEIMRFTCNSYEDCLLCDFGENCNHFEIHLTLRNHTLKKNGPMKLRTLK